MPSYSVYSPTVQSFLRGEQGPAELAPLSASALFPQSQFAQEALAGLWLFLGDMDRSHEISQRLSSREAAFWHGILHRREPDPSNAAYWFRRVGRHAVFPALREAAAAEAGYRQPGPEWDPFRWIDDWESARREPSSAPAHMTALAVQRIEWELLFDYCARP